MLKWWYIVGVVLIVVIFELFVLFGVLEWKV